MTAPPEAARISPKPAIADGSAPKRVTRGSLRRWAGACAATFSTIAAVDAVGEAGPGQRARGPAPATACGK